MANSITAHTRIAAARTDLKAAADITLRATEDLARKNYQTGGGAALANRTSVIRNILNKTDDELSKAQLCANALASVLKYPKSRSFSYGVAAKSGHQLVINTDSGSSNAQHYHSAAQKMEDIRQIILACKREIDSIKVSEQLVSSLNVLDIMFPLHGLSKAAMIGQVRDQGSRELNKAAVDLERLSEYFRGAGSAVVYGLELFAGAEEKARKAFFQNQIARTSQITGNNKPPYKDIRQQVDELESLQKDYTAIYGTPSPELEAEIKRLKKLLIVEVDVPLYGQKTNYTCGSASASMILAALGKNVSETDIWNWNKNKGRDPTGREYLVEAINHYLGEDLYTWKQSYKMNLDTYYKTIEASLEKGYPVQVLIAVNQNRKNLTGYTTSGHYVVITGIYRAENGEYRVKINDPFSSGFYKSNGKGAPQQLDLRLEDLKKISEAHSGSLILAKESAKARI